MSTFRLLLLSFVLCSFSSVSYGISESSSTTEKLEYTEDVFTQMGVKQGHITNVLCNYKYSIPVGNKKFAAGIKKVRRAYNETVTPISNANLKARFEGDEEKASASREQLRYNRAIYTFAMDVVADAYSRLLGDLNIDEHNAFCDR